MVEPPALTPGWFQEEVRRLGGAGFADRDRIALAVSGGADSLALLRLGAEAFPGRAHVLTVNHGLRAAAADECAMVARLATASGLAVDTLSLSLADGGNVQARAREARYRALAERCRALGIRWLLTAHHRDDQAETLLLRLARGSGLAGLASIGDRARIADISVLRPLLGRGRAELAAIVAAAGWTAAEDPSNTDPHYDRTRVRALLAATPWLSATRLAAAAAHLRQAEEALSWAEEHAWDSRAHSMAGKEAEGAIVLDPEGLPGELRRRLLERGLRALGAAPDGPALSRLLARLESGRTASLGPAVARPRHGRWVLVAAPPRRQRDAGA